MKALKIDTKTRREVGKALHKLSTEYHETIPLDAITETLNANGITLLMEDMTEFAGMLCGRDSRADFNLGLIGSEDDNGIYRAVQNSMLCLSWYTMQSGRFEITAYLS